MISIRSVGSCNWTSIELLICSPMPPFWKEVDVSLMTMWSVCGLGRWDRYKIKKGLSGQVQKWIWWILELSGWINYGLRFQVVIIPIPHADVYPESSIRVLTVHNVTFLLFLGKVDLRPYNSILQIVYNTFPMCVSKNEWMMFFLTYSSYVYLVGSRFDKI